MAPHYVLTLVHGTWASTKGWVAAGSFLRRELERRLSHVTFREFAWTGTNTHTARMDAGARLAEFIRSGHALYPDARHVVIAHSHGGNVALYAMRDPAAREAITGIVTLGSPFIRARRRDTQRYADALAWLMLGVAALVPFVVLDALQLTRVALAWLLAAIVLIVRLQPALFRWVIDTAALEQADIVAAYEPPAIEPSKLAILCTRVDEARGWLRTWDLLARGPFVVGCVLLSVAEVAARTNLPSLLDGIAAKTLRQGLDAFHVFGVDGWTLVMGGFVLCAVWGVVLMGSGVVRWPGYSREPLLANLLVEIGTDRVPGASGGTPHRAQIFDVPAPPKRSRRIRGWLRHGAICRDPAVVGAIGDWIDRT